MDDASKKDERINAPEVRGLGYLENAKLENMLPIWDDGRMIVEEEHIALKDEMRFATRKYRAPYGLEQLEMKQEEKELDATGHLYAARHGIQEAGPSNTLTPIGGRPWRHEKRSCGEYVVQRCT